MAMGAFLASKPNPSTGYMASTWLPGAANRCVDGTVPAAAARLAVEITARLTACACAPCARMGAHAAAARVGVVVVVFAVVSQSEPCLYARAVRARQPCSCTNLGRGLVRLFFSR